MIQTLLSLCALDAPSGNEGAVRDFIQKQAKPYADEMQVDALGNLMVLRRGEKTPARPFVICAHMDEVGFIIKNITDEGMLQFGFVGGIDPRVVVGKPVRFGKVQGVIGIKAVHLTTAAERKTPPRAKDLYIDIGAKSKSAAEGKVSLGDYGSFDSQPVEFGDGLIRAKAIDDRVGCAAMLELLREKPPFDTWFCFTVQEETGLRGASAIAHARKPAIALILEGTTAADLPKAENGGAVCHLRGGVVLPFMDGASIYDSELFTLLRDGCIKENIPWQTKTRIAGGTDAGRLLKSGEGVRVCAAAVPVRYIHSGSSVAAVCDIEAQLAAAKSLLYNLGGICE